MGDGGDCGDISIAFLCVTAASIPGYRGCMSLGNCLCLLVAYMADPDSKSAVLQHPGKPVARVDEALQ